MTKKFKDLRAAMPSERRRRNKVGADRLLLEMSLQELRQNVGELNQDDVAQMLKVTQGYVSKLERQDDMLLSKLYAYVQALGGEVEIRAQLAGKEIAIKQFGELGKLKTALAVGKEKKQTA